MKIKLTFFLLTWVILRSVSASGQQNSNAHAHGAGHMTLVFDNGHLLVEMKTPSINMLGFEHKPSTVEQWKLLGSLTLNLKQPNGLIDLEPDCQFINSVIDLPFKQKAYENAHEIKSQMNHKHSKDHHSTHSKVSSHRDGHSDIFFQYEWYCKDLIFPKLTLEYFKHYPAFDVITAEWIVNGVQGVTQLNKRENIVEGSK